MAGAGAAVGFGPVGVVAVQPVTELGVFFAGAGQDRHEPAAVDGDVVHRGPVSKFAVSDVEKVGSPDEGTKLVPGGDVGDVISAVAVLGPVRDRHRPIRGHSQDGQFQRSGRWSLLWP